MSESGRWYFLVLDIEVTVQKFGTVISHRRVRVGGNIKYGQFCAHPSQFDSKSELLCGVVIDP